MSRVFETYRAFHEQGFIPIFVKDDFDPKVLLEGCVAAGARVIEYTLRRPDADTMIPWIRENYPDLYLVIGSTLDDDTIVAQRKKEHPQLLTLAELDAMDVDGFVSMLGWSLESIRKYSPTRLVAPAAWTPTEALQEMGAGAHFIKVTGATALDLARRYRAVPTYGYCPVMVSGGMSLNRISDAFEAGAVTTASGFDLILRGKPKDITSKEVAEVMRQYFEAARAARESALPELAKAVGGDRQAWLDALPHYHPF